VECLIREKNELEFKEVPVVQVQEFWKKFSSAIRPEIREDDFQRAIAKAKEITISVSY